MLCALQVLTTKQGGKKTSTKLQILSLASIIPEILKAAIMAASVNFGAIGNDDIRMVFGLMEKEKYKASRIIKDTVEAGLIKAIDGNTVGIFRYTSYILTLSQVKHIDKINPCIFHHCM